MEMGSPSDAVLASLFMGYYEEKRLQSLEEWRVILYCRYVDHIICIFNSESDANEFCIF